MNETENEIAAILRMQGWKCEPPKAVWYRAAARAYEDASAGRGNLPEAFVNFLIAERAACAAGLEPIAENVRLLRERYYQ